MKLERRNMKWSRNADMSASLSWEIPVPDSDIVPTELATAAARCLTEAQLLERALKNAIENDLAAAGSGPEFARMFEHLRRSVTLGGARRIAEGSAHRALEKAIAEHVGFYVLLEMIWTVDAPKGWALASVLDRVVEQRNRLAHGLLAAVVLRDLTIAHAYIEVSDARKNFRLLRECVVRADSFSSFTGSVRPNGDSHPRVVRQGPPVPIGGCYELPSISSEKASA